MKKLIIFICKYHWIWLTLAVPFLVFPTPKRSLALLVVPFLWMLYLSWGRIENRNGIENIKYKIENGIDGRVESVFQPDFPVTPLNISLLVLTLMLLVSLWATYSIEQSLEKISGVVLGLGVFYAVVRESRKPSGWWWSLAAFLAGGLGWATLASWA